MKKLEDVILDRCHPLEPEKTTREPRLNPIAGSRAVLFDLYGTLFVSGSGDVGTAAASDTAEALTQALVVSGFEGELEQAGQVGRDMIRQEILDWHAAARKSGTDYPEVEITKIWKRIIDTLRNTETLRKQREDMDQIRRLALEYECRVNPVFPMPHALEVLKELKQRGFTMGIVSNAQFFSPLLFSAFFGQSHEELGFDPECCIWSYKELKAKPSTALFAKAEKFLQKNHALSLKETVYVGNDMLNDMYTAHQAGCRTVLFAGDRRSLRLREDDDRCRDLHPDAVITDLTQLLDIL